MAPPRPTGRQTAPWFLAKALLLLLLLFAPVYAGGEALRRFVPWQAAQDPRERLLWDTLDPRTEIVLLGDSEFYSCQVDGPGQLLWNRLTEYSGRTVFPGALSGAMPTDFRNAARRVAEAGGGAVVFIDLIPTRFFRFAEVDPERMVFPELCRAEFAPTADGVEAWLRQTLSAPFFAWRSPEAFQRALKGRTQASYFRRGNSRNFVWTERPVYAQDSFARLRRKVERLDALPPVTDFGLVESLQSILSRAGFRPVFVLTPRNRALVAAYAPDDYGAKLTGFLDTLHARLRNYLDAHGWEYLDLTDAAPSEAFADLVHTNAAGDDLMARAMADYLAQHPAAR